MNTTDYTPARPADFDYDAALSELQEKIRRKKKAKNLLTHFTEEADRLNSVMEDRKKEYEQEQEESEALAAKAEYENAKAELDHILARQVELRAEIRSLGNCERDYEEMVAEKKAWLMAKEATVNTEVEALEGEKAAIIRDSKELKEAMESGQYALRVARSVMDALAKAQVLSYRDTVGYRNSHHSVPGVGMREADIDYEKHSTLVRLDNSIQTLGKYLKEFSAELKDVAALPMEHLPSTSFSDGLLFLDRWVEGLFAEIVISVKLDNIQKKMMPLLGKLTPIVSGLEKEYAAREAACKEIDEKIREIVLGKQ